jgi:arginyl-tRNA synthetase
MHKEIREAIENALTELSVTDVAFVVEHPADLTHGDYATNVAMVCAKKLGKNPREIAEQFRAALAGSIQHVESISIAGPGFINFTLARDFFKEKIASVIAHPDSWGKNESWKGKKVLVEYTDPNPFKEFHIGHLFTNTVGESIARLFMMNGADTKRVNYQGDVGLHVAHALWGMKELDIAAKGTFTARDLGRAYAHGATAYKNEDSRAVQEIRDINKKVYDRSDVNVNALYDAGRKVSLDFFEEMYAIIDTQFDEYFFESEAGPKGKELVLTHPDVFTESDGARIFEGEKYGLHTRVFLNKEGLPTYEAKELALAKLKEERLGSYDHSAISTANEITEYFKVLKKAMSFIYPELEAKTEHIGHGTVRLASGKMSSRTGDVIPAIDFIDEVADAAAAKMDEGGKTAPTEELARDIALGAIKYATLRGSIHQDSVFDKEKALSFEGDSGPYLQYTHARIVSVLEKAQSLGVNPDTTNAPEIPYLIEKTLYRFPEVVRAALDERAPHKVAVYLTELAGAFNTFYGEEKIADASDVHAPYKAAIADAVRITLKNGLWTLGIKAPEKM